MNAQELEREVAKGLSPEDEECLLKIFGGGREGAIRLGRFVRAIKQGILNGESFAERVRAITAEQSSAKTLKKPRLSSTSPKKKAAKKAAPRRRTIRRTEEAVAPAPEESGSAGEGTRDPRSTRQAKAGGKQPRGKNTGGAGEDLRAHVQRPGG